MHRHRILVIEDEAELADLLTEILSDLSYEVEQASTMGEALAILDRGPVCAILSDLTLPDIEREQVVHTLRARSGRASIILMSAIASQDLTRLGRQMGVDRVVSKPFDLDEFEDSLVFGCEEGQEEAGEHA
ncbi:MAG TPA: response regulator [Vulgatibacter sp.]|nr:response regulator [Vulgatibacter sp.]